MKQYLSMNYTNVCWYCGKVYKSNKSTSKYCNPKHNALYAKYGPQIKLLLSKSESPLYFDDILHDIYCEIDMLTDDGWGIAYSLRAIREDFAYTGPLPLTTELVVVGNYVIGCQPRATSDGRNIYFVKPFTELTKDEKRGSLIIQGKMD